MDKRKILAANWKMNKNIVQAKEYVRAINNESDCLKNCQVIIFPPFVALESVACGSLGLFGAGAQNVHHENSGAFTGEISAEMIVSAGAKYVLIGHSERRKYFGETDEIISEKIVSALNAGLKVVLCVGETLDERESGNAESVVLGQVQGALKNVDAQFLQNIIVAYEPVWAIGTGKVISPHEADIMALTIKNAIKRIFSLPDIDVPVLYGGSLNLSNVTEFLSMPNINGGLIGGASLEAENFLKMIKLSSNL